MNSIAINADLINQTAQKAALAERQRTNYNFHQSAADEVQRMLNAIEPGSYVQPHRHLDPPKDEVFLCLTGKGAVLTFDDLGEVQQIYRLDPTQQDFGVEILAGTWHSILSLEPGSVFYEVKHGPYVPLNDKDFASWAPKEGQAEVVEYLSSLEAQARKAMGL